ncbi:MAG: hypothetical protein AAGA16_18095, partial [Cyanobacteria bacterium P01_E01_bin.35]
ASFSCQFTDGIYPIHSVFQNVVPRFVRIYSAKTSDSLLNRVRQMLETEALFISQNYDRLKKALDSKIYFLKAFPSTLITTLFLTQDNR